MSAIWKAEINSLQSLVENHASHALTAAQREQSAIGQEGRRKGVARMVRLSQSNRRTILAHVKKLKAPASALKIAEHTGVSDETCRRTLIKLADEGLIAASIPNPATGWKRYGPITKT